MGSVGAPGRSWLYHRSENISTLIEIWKTVKTTKETSSKGLGGKAGIENDTSGFCALIMTEGQEKLDLGQAVKSLIEEPGSGKIMYGGQAHHDQRVRELKGGEMHNSIHFSAFFSDDENRFHVNYFHRTECTTV